MNEISEEIIFKFLKENLTLERHIEYPCNVLSLILTHPTTHKKEKLGEITIGYVEGSIE